MDEGLKDILTYWFGDPQTPEYGQYRPFWFSGGETHDSEIRQKFLPLYHKAVSWGERPLDLSAEETLALILLFDQFPRHMFRGTSLMFATDAQARSLAYQAVEGGLDKDLSQPLLRAFVYMPFEHSESLEDQALSVKLFRALGEPGFLDWAERHRKTIEKFHRFPHRNAVLGRSSTPEEEAFLDQNPLGF